MKRVIEKLTTKSLKKTFVLALAAVMATGSVAIAAEVKDTASGTKEVVRGSETEVPNGNDGWRLTDTKTEQTPIYGEPEIIGYEPDNTKPIYDEPEIVGYEEDMTKPIYGEPEITGYEEDNTKPIYGEREIIGYEPDMSKPIYDEPKIIGYEPDMSKPIYGEPEIIGYEQDKTKPVYGEPELTGTFYKANGNMKKVEIVDNNGQQEKAEEGLAKIMEKAKSITYDRKGNPLAVVDSKGKVIVCFVYLEKANCYGIPVSYDNGNKLYYTGDYKFIEPKIIGYEEDKSKPIYGDSKITGYEEDKTKPIYSKVEIIGYEDGEPIFGEAELLGYESDLSKPIYGEPEIIGYENGEPIYGEAEIIGYENGEPIYGEAQIIGYGEKITDIYERFIWVPDNNGGSYVDTYTGNEVTPQEMVDIINEEVDIEDIEVPLADAPQVIAAKDSKTADVVEDVVDIEEDEVPLANMPQTGLADTLPMLILGLSISLMGTVSAIVLLRRNRQNQAV